MGADGRMEYEFNRRMVQLIAADLRHDDRIRVIVVNPEGKRISLSGRSEAAKAAGAESGSVLVSNVNQLTDQSTPGSTRL